MFSAKQRFYSLPKKDISPEERLDQVFDWLVLAHRVTDWQGVSASYSLVEETWEKAYRETTGYLIPSFIVYGQRFNKREFVEQALLMAKWETRIQNKNGSFGEEKQDGSVSEKIFNTGQIIIGLISVYQLTKENQFLSTAKKAGDWLLARQKPEGFWIEEDDLGPKTYQARVSWALLLLWQATGLEKYYQAALKNIEWVLGQQTQNGWFRNSGLGRNNKSVWVHFLGYTVSGLWESGQLISDFELRKKIFLSVELFFKNLFPRIKSNGFLAGEFDENWRGDSSYSCLVGNLQLAIVALKFYSSFKKRDYLDLAKKLIRYTVGTIAIGGPPESRGTIAGSWPVNGKYSSYILPNWGAKFLADCLLIYIFSEDYGFIG